MEPPSHAQVGELVSFTITLSKEVHSEGRMSNKFGGEFAMGGNPDKFNTDFSFNSASGLMNLCRQESAGAIMTCDNVECCLAIGDYYDVRHALALAPIDAFNGL